ncbi:Major facilitator superfamily domain, general substrate transporter [Penicillium digitatum]|uniref:Major facilitator superfamily domain, general substrate transporter n=1 Tax=Penicillium digitatum TaxID=36651 RepID=A0A7T6XEI0_PENDI|nr:Major facilitator superfamily domain, general substrate transporter [Penicillium digitatum]
MKNPVKQLRFPALEDFIEYVQDFTETSSRWINWQIIRGKRHIWWETDWDVVSRWAQSIIETEQRLRETTQRENFLKKWIHTFHNGSNEAGKFVLPDLIEDLIALDHEYGPSRRDICGFESSRSGISGVSGYVRIVQDVVGVVVVSASVVRLLLTR